MREEAICSSERSFTDLARSNNAGRESLWKGMPPTSKWFFAETGQVVCLQKLLRFWNNFRDETWDPVTSWMLAYEYLNMKCQQVANNLLLNGVFLEYAYSSHSSLGAAIDFLSGVEVEAQGPGRDDRLREVYPWLVECCEVLGRPYEMSNYLVVRIPTALTLPHCSKNEAIVKPLCCENWNDKSNVEDILSKNEAIVKAQNEAIVKSLSCDWKGAANSNIENTPSASEGRPENKKLMSCFFLDADGVRQNCAQQVIRVRFANNERLKDLFSQYAVRRKASLRSLHFSYMGRTIFPSVVGNKTLRELHLEHNFNIMVEYATYGYEKDALTDENASSGKGSNTYSSKNRCKGRQTRTARQRSQWPEAKKTMADSKIEHSMALGKLHEEARPRFRMIRQRLNNLLIEKSKPKEKSTRPLKCASLPCASAIDNPTWAGIGGKAGKSRFVVQVGEVANLHKSSKRYTRDCQQQLQIDLHGMTKEEALKTLEKNLPRWIDNAMSGSYPFVATVEIICGCGRQALSEMVEHWIKCHDQVANAPKTKC